VEEVTDGEEGADRWGPPVGVKRKEKRKKEEQREGCGLRPARVGFWAPGTTQFGLVPSSSPFSLFFSDFLFPL
jgi:hypothetical protein